MSQLLNELPDGIEWYRLDGSEAASAFQTGTRSRGAQPFIGDHPRFTSQSPLHLCKTKWPWLPAT